MQQKVSLYGNKSLSETLLNGVKNELVNDIKALGKELALDIIALNKKIETRNTEISQKMADWEIQSEKREE